MTTVETIVCFLLVIKLLIKQELASHSVYSHSYYRRSQDGYTAYYNFTAFPNQVYSEAYHTMY